MSHRRPGILRRREQGNLSTKERKYFIRRGETVRGPFAIESVREMARQGRIDPSDGIAKQPNGPWTCAAKAKGLFPPSPPPIDLASAGASAQPIEPPPAPTTLPTQASPSSPPQTRSKGFRQWPLFGLIIGIAVLVCAAAVALVVVIPWWLAASPAPPQMAPIPEPTPTSKPSTTDRRSGHPAAGAGPLIKGLQLGMPLDDAKEQIRRITEPLGLETKFTQTDPQTQDKVVFKVTAWRRDDPKTETIIAWLGASAVGSLTRFTFEGPIVDSLFNSKQIPDQAFLQNVVNAYDIPEIKRVDSNARSGEGFSGTWKAYEYRDPSGWFTRIEVEDVASLIGSWHHRRILVWRTTSDSELKFD